MRLRSAPTGLFGAAALVSILTLAARLAGFARVAVFSPSVGATQVGAVYQSVNALPNVVFEVAAGGALASAVIPVLAPAFAARARERSNQVASALLTWAMTILVPLALILGLAAGPISRALVPGDSTASLGARLLIVFAPQVVLYGIAVMLSGMLQADHRFAWPALAPLLSSLVVILAYLGYGHASAGDGADAAALADDAVRWLGWGTTAGAVALSLPLFIPVARAGIRLRPTWRFPRGVARQVVSLSVAGLGAVAAQQLSVVVIIYLANHHGGTTALPTYTYLQACYMLPYAVLAVPLATVAFPRLSELAEAPSREGFARLAAVSVRGVCTAAMVGVAALVAAAPGIEGLFVALDRGSVVGLSGALSIAAPSVLGLSVLALVTRALYSLKNGRMAAIVGSAGWVGVAVVAAVLVVTLGTDASSTLAGLAAGTSIAMVGAGIGAVVALVKAAGRPAAQGLARTVAVLLAGGALGAVAGRMATDYVIAPGVWHAVLAALTGGVLAAVLVIAAVAVGDRHLVASFRSATRPGVAL